MKKLIAAVIITCLISAGGKAQVVAPAKINLLNMISGTFYEIRTSTDEKKPIQVKSRTWVVIQTIGDSLSFIIDNKPYFLHFDSGKQYYFVIEGGYNSRPVITEKSKREFIMTANINSVKGPEEAIVSKVNN
ncbi:hypothetical protein ACFSUS_11065 [Spirosoma soli]|uniref:DUF4488 domain-containing protein n=1 Tax=Spirosoma soli TaxID=1770529 RepID=A0ABW5M2A4_9BACT